MVELLRYIYIQVTGLTKPRSITQYLKRDEIPLCMILQQKPVLVLSLKHILNSGFVDVTALQRYERGEYLIRYVCHAFYRPSCLCVLMCVSVGIVVFRVGSDFICFVLFYLPFFFRSSPIPSIAYMEFKDAQKVTENASKSPQRSLLGGLFGKSSSSGVGSGSGSGSEGGVGAGKFTGGALFNSDGNILEGAYCFCDLLYVCIHA